MADRLRLDRLLTDPFFLNAELDFYVTLPKSDASSTPHTPPDSPRTTPGQPTSPDRTGTDPRRVGEAVAL